jgi:hypothetical protein
MDGSHIKISVGSAVYTPWRPKIFEPYIWSRGPRGQDDGLPLFTDLAHICREVGLRGFKKLPIELLDIIQEYAEPCLLLRYNMILSLAEILSSEDEASTVCPINHVSSWHRGGIPDMREEGDNKAALVRLTIDRRGLRQIERLSTPSDGLPCKSGCLFVVERAGYVFSVTAEFRVSRTPTPAALILRTHILTWHSSGFVVLRSHRVLLSLCGTHRRRPIWRAAF